MAVSELDPLFVKALKLLHSKNKDAADQLKELLDDVLAQHKKQKELDSEEKSDEKSSKKYGSRKDQEKKEPEKRHLDQLSKNLAELSQDSVPAKRSKTEQSNSSGEPVKKEELKRVREYKNSDSDDDVERAHETENKVAVPIIKDDDSGSDNELEAVAQHADDSNQKSPTDIDSFVIDQGLACVICKSFGVTSSNQLVECQECHSLYHQDCHNPPPPKNVNDPRFVWYCSQCTKTIKKSVPKPPVKAKVASSSSSKDSSSMKMPPSKSDSNLLNLQPFKRTEAVKMTSSSSVATGSAMGLAGLAEKLHSKSLSSAGEQSKQSKSAAESQQQQPAKTSSSSSKSSSSSADPTGIGALFKPDPVKVVSSKSSALGSQASAAKSLSVLSGGSGSSKQSEKTGSGSVSSAKVASFTSSQSRMSGQSTTSVTSSSSSSGSKPQASSLSSSSSTAAAAGDKKAPAPATSTADAADKRLQMMKKKAAAVAQSKKNLIK